MCNGTDILIYGEMKDDLGGRFPALLISSHDDSMDVGTSELLEISL
jgi:hypothetical protein